MNLFDRGILRSPLAPSLIPGLVNFAVRSHPLLSWVILSSLGPSHLFEFPLDALVGALKLIMDSLLIVQRELFLVVSSLGLAIEDLVHVHYFARIPALIQLFLNY